MFTKQRIIASFMLFAALFAGMQTMASAAGESNSSEAINFAPLEGELTPVSVTDAGDAQVVTVGMYGTNVYELSVENSTFYFSGYLWMRWNGDITPTDSLEFVNAVETWGLMITPLTEEPEQLPNGDFVQTLSVQGRFYQTFPLQDYPLDSQSLSIMIEDTTNTSDKIVFVADDEFSGVSNEFKMQGYEVKGMSAQSYVHTYGTDFGYTGTVDQQSYSALEFQVHIERNSNLFIWKLLLPLVLVLITNWMSLLLNPRLVEVRTAMPATALLTTVFLQQSAMESVSQASVLVLMDQVYLAAYAAIVLTLAQIIWDNHRVKAIEDAETAGIARHDRLSLIIQSAVTVAVLLALILPRL